MSEKTLDLTTKSLKSETYSRNSFPNMLEVQEGRVSAENIIKTKPIKPGVKSKKLKPKTSHPPVAIMVNKALETLSSKKGCSVVAIKKYLAENFKIDADKLGVFIKKYLAKAVENKLIIQTTGKGCTGSFKLSQGTSKIKKPVQSHVTASGGRNQNAKVKMSSVKSKKPTSKQRLTDGSRKVGEHKRICVTGKRADH